VRVSILGTGAMGGAMARRLHGAGHDVAVWNRSRQRAEDLAAEVGGMQVAGSPAAAVAGAEVVISMLADREAVEQVFLGPEGAAEASPDRAVFLEMSTVEPEVSQSLAPRLRERGGDLLDAPVSGSVPAVEQGSLMIMAGGEERSLERARPVLDTLAKRVIHLGPVGAGAAMKLAVNAVVHGLNEALAEGLVLAEAAGIERSLAYEVFASSAAGAPFVQYKRQAYEQPEDAPVAFRLALVRKDLELILDFSERLGVPLPQGRANLGVVEAAAGTYGDRDMSAIAQHLRAAIPAPGKERQA
jgi:3-hydroxyisobutyrate dehydrogenase-like beta-hydroxyacid dehydrogenase